jgi:hypothetical protein
MLPGIGSSGQRKNRVIAVIARDRRDLKGNNPQQEGNAFSSLGNSSCGHFPHS